jgi:hypothetical protein
MLEAFFAHAQMTMLASSHVPSHGYSGGFHIGSGMHGGGYSVSVGSHAPLTQSTSHTASTLNKIESWVKNAFHSFTHPPMEGAGNVIQVQTKRVVTYIKVAQQDAKMEGTQRTITANLEDLEKMGLCPGTPEERIRHLKSVGNYTEV